MNNNNNNNIKLYYCEVDGIGRAERERRIYM